MRSILVMAMALICAAAISAQETKPAKPASPDPAKAKPADRNAREIERVARAISAARLRARTQRVLTAEQQTDQTSNKTVEAKALEAKLVHISHLASQAARTTDLDAVEKKLREMEQQLMEARVKLWKAREAEAKAKAKKEGKAKN